MFEIEESIPLIRHIFFKRWKGKINKVCYMDDGKRREYEARNKAIVNEIEVCKLSIDFKV